MRGSGAIGAAVVSVVSVVSIAATLCIISASARAEEPQPKLATRAQSGNASIGFTTLDEKTAFSFSQSAIGKPVGDFVLLNREGKPVELSKYRGRPLLVNFIYTACFQVCPTATRNLQKAVLDTVGVMGAERFNIISIGFNQPFDSPQALKEFSVRHGINLPNWEFLSPSPAILDSLTTNFGFSYTATTAGFDHLNQVTMVDAEGKIVKQVYGERFTARDLAEPLKLLITGSAIPPETGTLKEVMERVRILCSVYDPVTGRYKTNYSVYFMIAGFITFMIFLIVMCVHFWKNRRRSNAVP
jgi:protein SCO1/2